jgi:long-chain acyl-CoA synthetase
MSFYDELQSATETSRQYLLSAPIIADVMSRQFSLATYGAFLNQAYYHVRHTIPLLMLAGGRLSATQQWLQAPIARYIAEELGHEAWILDDMANCGWDRRVVSAGEAPYHSDLLVAYLYDTAAA